MSTTQADLNEVIVKAATELFRVKGFLATTTDEIARAAGTTKRTLYRHVPSKQHILLAVHERMLELTLSNLPEDVGSMSPEASLAAFIDAHVRTLVTYRAEAHVFFSQMKYLSDDVRAAVVNRRDVYESQLKDAIDRGISDGSFRVVDSGIATKVLLGALNGIHRWAPSQASSSVSLSKTIARWFLDGLECGPPGVLAESTGEELPDLLRRHAGGGPAASHVIEAVTQVAAELFAERGFDGATSADIAEAAGIGKAALYYHIESKAFLLGRILEGVNTDIAAIIAAVRECSESPQESLIFALWGLSLYVARNPYHVAVGTELGPGAAGPFERGSESLVVSVFVEFLTETCQSSESAGSETIESLSHLLADTVVGLAQWYTQAGRLDAYEVSRRVADVCVAGVAGRQLG